MSILTANEILKQRDSKFIVIEPFHIENLNSNSYDLTLHNELKQYVHAWLDVKDPDSFQTRTITIPETGYKLKAGKCYLARTNEYTSTWNYVPTLNGKSGIGRMFLSVCADAGYGDVGYSGYWTLQLCPRIDVKVYADMKIVQIQYESLEGLIRETYKGKYQDSKDITASKEYEAFTK